MSRFSHRVAALRVRRDEAAIAAMRARLCRRVGLSKDAAPTAPKQRGRPFKPGQSGNPAGRQKGTRNKLSESFVAALYDDFEKNGVKAIEAMRIEKPNEYVKVVAGLVPAQFQSVDGDGNDQPFQIIIRKLGDD